MVCKQLGFTHAHSSGTTTYGKGTGAIVLDDVNCYGREKSVTHCAHITKHNCGHSEDISIKCKALRLVGSPSYREGKRANVVIIQGKNFPDSRKNCLHLQFSLGF